MKRFLWLMVSAVLIFSAAKAESFFYSTASVTDCAKTSASYDRFYESGALDTPIPGLTEGFVPQGICLLPGKDWVLFAGYRTDKANSALIAVDRNTGSVVREAFLYNQDGSIYNGHAGGVCATETDIYLSNDHKLYRIALDDFLTLPASSDCVFTEVIPVPVNSSYCCYSEGILWVGEFQYKGDYPTDTSHRVKTADGLQRAWTCGYVMHDSQDFSSPDYVLSMTERIQGITTAKDSIYLSQSYGRRVDSVLYRYRNVLKSKPDATVKISGKDVPLWILDSSVREDALLCPPMTECLCTLGEDILVLFESAAETYMNPQKPSVNPMDRVFLLRDF